MSRGIFLHIGGFCREISRRISVSGHFPHKNGICCLALEDCMGFALELFFLDFFFRELLHKETALEILWRCRPLSIEHCTVIQAVTPSLPSFEQAPNGISSNKSPFESGSIATVALPLPHLIPRESTSVTRHLCWLLCTTNWWKLPRSSLLTGHIFKAKGSKILKMGSHSCSYTQADRS